jgi:nucleotidyltransferase/DNA polymerase involved in DNA repair
MPSITAKRQCPDLIFVKPRFDAYEERNHCGVQRRVELSARKLSSMSRDVFRRFVNAASAAALGGLPCLKLLAA